MTKSIEQIAKETWAEISKSTSVGESIAVKFAYALLDKMDEGLKPIGYIESEEFSSGSYSENYFSNTVKFNVNIDKLSANTKLYATPHEATIAAEQRVAEACRKLAEERSCKAADSWDRGFNSASDDIANAIRSDSWRKYYEQEAKS